MAQGLMRHTAPTQIAVTSAGTHAKTAVNDLSAQVLAELGIDASDHQPTQLTDTLIGAATSSWWWAPFEISSIGYRRSWVTCVTRRPQLTPSTHVANRMNPPR
jgi:hypothetical protein